MFESLELLPPDAIIGLIAEYKVDPRETKVDLGIGVYRNAAGETPVLDVVKRAFEHRHEELYAYHLPDQHPVLINARVATIGLLSDLPVEPEARAMSEAAHTGHRRIYLDDWIEATVFPLDELASGQVVARPAIIESDTTTPTKSSIVDPGFESSLRIAT